MNKALDRLADVIAQLRDPKGGCAWDLEQTFKTIAPYTLEEAYEVIEAIEQNDVQAIKDELGDLLFQIVFLARLGEEEKLFDLNQIAMHAADKMVERHPHVFGDRTADNAAAVVAHWETDKAAKRAAAALKENRPLSELDGISIALPATTRALKIQSRAARVGFDWAEPRDILLKIREEIDELDVEMKREEKDAIEDELGDVFFALINMARRLEVDPETALRRTNRKFERRFREIESRLATRKNKMADASLEEMEAIWNDIKAEEKRELSKGRA